MGPRLDREAAGARRLTLASKLVLSALGVALLVWMNPKLHASDRASPAAARSVEVHVSADSGVVLAGTLSYPAGVTPSREGARTAAVILVSGSGPQDRDGARAELPGYVPFRDLAGALNGAGMTVLRLDDRGTGGSSGRFAGATTLDFARDVGAAIHWLRAQPGVDPARVSLLGHSEGALVSLIAASHDSLLSALVLLGAPSRTGRELARWQRAALVASDAALYPAAERSAVLEEAEGNAERTAGADEWMRVWFALDPRAIARETRAPVLLLHGENDRQVPVEQAAELAAVLRTRVVASGARPAEVRVQRFPSTDHLFLEDHDGDPQGYVRLLDRTVRPSVVQAVSAWLPRQQAVSPAR